MPARLAMEKRQAARILTGSEIHFRSNQGTDLGAGSVQNVSQGGILVALVGQHALSQVAKGDVVKFRFVLPTGPLSGDAEVAWADSAERTMGLRFLALDDAEGLSRLMEFLGSLL
jgi:hypothetical protein